MSGRVVVTGMGGISPLGSTWGEVREKLRASISGVSHIDEWAGCDGMQSQLGAKAAFSPPAHWDRRHTRTMGRVSLMAAQATESALRQADLLEHPALTDGRCGVAYGSTAGSPPAIEEYFKRISLNRSLKGLSPYTYIQLMSHTCAANLCQFFEVKGRVKDSTTVTVTKNEILTALNKPEDFILAIVEVDGDATTTHYIARPFQREPDFGATSVNYDLEKLRNKGVVPV